MVLTDRTLQQRADDFQIALISFGIPTTYHLSTSLLEGDMEELAYWGAMELATIGTYTGMLAIANLISPKNFVPLKHVHHMVGGARTFILRGALAMSPFALPITYALAGGTLGLGDYRNRMAEHRSHYSPMTQRKMR